MSEINHPAISAIIKIVADAVNDTGNALGSGKKAMTMGDYGSLFWDMLKACRHIKGLPTEVYTLSQEESGPIVNELTSQMRISSVHAQAIVDAGTKLLSNFLHTTVGSVEAIASAIKDEGAAKRLASAKTQK